MTDHLAEARRITEGQTAYDFTALSCGILHALIAIAERMGEGRASRLSEVRAEQERLTVALRLAQARATDAADLADLLAAKIDAVRELHAPYHPFRGGSAYCRACEGNVMVTYPCPTIRALDGEADR